MLLSIDLIIKHEKNILKEEKGPFSPAETLRGRVHSVHYIVPVGRAYPKDSSSTSR
jgi:hypothetical protein